MFVYKTYYYLFTRGESQGTCNVTRTPPRISNKTEPTLALQPRGDVTRSPKQGYQCSCKKDSCPPKFFLKKDLLLLRSTDTSIKMTIYLPAINSFTFCTRVNSKCTDEYQ